MTLSKIIEQLKAADQNKSGMFELGEDVMCALVDLLERRERDGQEPAPQIKNLEHFIAFWRKVQGGHILPSKNDIDHTVWFMEGLADIAAPPAPVVSEELLTSMEEVLRISDRQHDAWDKAKAAVSAFRTAALNQTHVNQASSNGQSFGNSGQLNSPAVPDGFRIVSLDALGAACGALQRHAPDCKTLKLLRRYTFGDLSKPSASLAAAPKQESE